MDLLCPVCALPLRPDGGSYRCENRHCYDKAKEGYVNLLAGTRSGDSTGDNRAMALARRSFLSKGYFDTLLHAVETLLQKNCPPGGEVLDICCGEGYYSTALQARNSRFSYTGFDLSREMVRLAAKRKSDITYFVANLMHIPLPDASIDFAFHLFAPFNEEEFFRVLKPGGTLVTAVAGDRHLWQLKEVLYDEPYLNDEKPPKTLRQPAKTLRTAATIALPCREDIGNLLKMTPYFYHTPSEGLRRLEEKEALETEISFVLYVYEKEANDGTGH